MTGTTDSNTRPKKNRSFSFRMTAATADRIDTLAEAHGGKTRLIGLGVEIIHRIDPDTMAMIMRVADDIGKAPAQVIADIVNASHNRMRRKLRSGT